MKQVKGYQTSDGAFFEKRHDAEVRERELELVATIETSIYKPKEWTTNDVADFFMVVTKHCKEVAAYATAVVIQQEARYAGETAELRDIDNAADELKEDRKAKKIT